MCVAASQKPMQSASDLPPPPGALGFAWLGLSDEVPGERASEEPPEEPPPPVKVLMGKGSDMGCSGGTNDPGCGVVGVVGVVVAAAPAGGVSPPEGAGELGDNGVGDNRVSPAEGVGDNDVDGAAGVAGAESLGLGAVTDAPPAEERTCASAASGSSSKRAMVARAVNLRVSIAITMALQQHSG